MTARSCPQGVVGDAVASIDTQGEWNASFTDADGLERRGLHQHGLPVTEISARPGTCETAARSTAYRATPRAWVPSASLPRFVPVRGRAAAALCERQACAESRNRDDLGSLGQAQGAGGTFRTPPTGGGHVREHVFVWDTLIQDFRLIRSFSRRSREARWRSTPSWATSRTTRPPDVVR